MEVREGVIWDKKCFSVNCTLPCAKSKAPSLALFLNYQCDARQERIIHIQRDEAAETSIVVFP